MAINITTISPMQMANRFPYWLCNTAFAFSNSMILASKLGIGTSIVDEIVKWIVANTERIISIVAIIASYFIGVYSNRRNDRRKEFNSVADQLHIRFIKAKKDLESGFYIQRSLVNEDEILTLSIHMKEREREKLVAAYKEFRVAASMIKWDKNHKPTLEDDVRQQIVESLKPLIELTKHR